MAATVTLSEQVLAIEPGETGRCELTVVNSGTLVDQFSVTLVGDTQSWTTAEPVTMNLMPGTSGTVTVTFAPPRSAEVVAGSHDFGVRIASREDPAGTVVEEGRVEVAEYRELAAELVPGKRRARRRARFKLAVDNLGNTPVRLELAGTDPDDELGLVCRPATVELAAGTAAIVKVTAVPRRRFLRGPARLLPFEVAVIGENAEPVSSQGVVEQVQLLPRWLLPALAAAAVAIVGAVAAWFMLLKPAVVSVAKEQSEQQVSRAENAAGRASGAAEQAGAAATVAQQAAGISPTPPGTGSPAPSTTPVSPGRTSAPAPSTGRTSGPATPTGPVPLNFRVAASAKVATDGSFDSFRYQAPPGRTVAIADLVLQNPRGDSGILRLFVGDVIVLETGLANFRDLDYHYLEPLHVPAGQAVTVAVNCTAAGSGADRCTPSVSFSGQLR